MTALQRVVGHDDGGFITAEHHSKGTVRNILQPLRVKQTCHIQGKNWFTLDNMTSMYNILQKYWISKVISIVFAQKTNMRS